MPITADMVATALNAAGVDTQAELDAWAASLINKGPELEKVVKRLNRLDTRWQAELNARENRVGTLRNQLETARRDLEKGEAPSGPVPTPAQIDEIAPQTPFTPAT